MGKQCGKPVLWSKNGYISRVVVIPPFAESKCRKIVVYAIYGSHVMLFASWTVHGRQKMLMLRITLFIPSKVLSGMKIVGLFQERLPTSLRQFAAKCDQFDI